VNNVCFTRAIVLTSGTSVQQDEATTKIPEPLIRRRKLSDGSGEEDGVVEVRRLGRGWEIVAAQSVLVLDGGRWTGSTRRAAAHLSFDCRGSRGAFVVRCVDFELVVGRRVVAAIAGIGVEPLDRGADELLDPPGITSASVWPS